MFHSSGGLETLFDDKKTLSTSPPAEVTTLGELIPWIKQTLIRHKHDMFATGDTVRPGVLVLVNDVDWELENTVKYALCDGDRIAFISTLHGG